jgi:hypothetical protein
MANSGREFGLPNFGVIQTDVTHAARVDNGTPFFTVPDSRRNLPDPTERRSTQSHRDSGLAKAVPFSTLAVHHSVSQSTQVKRVCRAETQQVKKALDVKPTSRGRRYWRLSRRQ